MNCNSRCNLQLGLLANADHGGDSMAVSAAMYLLVTRATVTDLDNGDSVAVTQRCTRTAKDG